MNADLDGYRAVTSSAGWIALPARTQLMLSGQDRQTFLHNYCTADIKKLAVGQGCEALLTSVQGKTLGHGLIWAGETELVVDGEPGYGDTWLAHLDRYLLRDNVQLTDVAPAERPQLWILGPRTSEIVSACELTLPPGPLGQIESSVAGAPLAVRRIDRLAVPWSVFVLRGLEEAERWRERLRALQLPEVTSGVWEILRLEAGWPRFGTDITAQNLPQELGRDAQAISFTKGCYLGQETVARIDALGHVNRCWTGIMFPADAGVKVSDELRAGERTVGEITSVGYSPRLAAALAVGYIRREFSRPGTELTTAEGPTGRVVSLPISAEATG